MAPSKNSSDRKETEILLMNMAFLLSLSILVALAHTQHASKKMFLFWASAYTISSFCQNKGEVVNSNEKIFGRSPEIRRYLHLVLPANQLRQTATSLKMEFDLWTCQTKLNWEQKCQSSESLTSCQKKTWAVSTSMMTKAHFLSLSSQLAKIFTRFHNKTTLSSCWEIPVTSGRSLFSALKWWLSKRQRRGSLWQ